MSYPNVWSNVLEHGNEYKYDLGSGVMKIVNTTFGFYKTPAEILK